MRIQFLFVVLPTSIIAAGIGFGLGVLISKLLDAFDPHDPLALFRTAAPWLRAFRSRMSDLADKGIAAYRERTRSHSPAHARSR